jgi:hypothetical protein
MFAAAQRPQHVVCLQSWQVAEEVRELGEDASVGVGVGDYDKKVIDRIVTLLELQPPKLCLKVVEARFELDSGPLSVTEDHYVPGTLIGPISMGGQRHFESPSKRLSDTFQELLQARSLTGVADRPSARKRFHGYIESEYGTDTARRFN